MRFPGSVAGFLPLTGALLLARADPVAAEPRLDLSWDACSPLVVDKTAGPADRSFTLYCSVTGMTQQHRGYQVNLWFAGPMVCHDQWTTPPGAMRAFAAVGYANTVQTPDPLRRYQLSSIRFDHTYSVEGPGTPGATCGGFEQPVCFALFPRAGRLTGSCFGYAGYEDASFLDAAGQPQEFGFGQPYLSFGREPGVWQWCFEATPARAATWGAIKSPYR